MRALGAEKRITIMQGNGGFQRETNMQLGLDALFRGHERDSDGWKKLIETAGDDMDVGIAIQQVFLDTLAKAGIEVENIEGQ